MNIKQSNQNKKQLFIGATVQPIQNFQLLASSEDSSLFFHKRSLIIMNIINKTLKSSLIQDQRIIFATYYRSLEVFIIHTDRYLIIINKQAEIIHRQRVHELLQAKSLIILNMQDGYDGVPNQRRDILLFFTNQCMFYVNVVIKYERSLLKTKSLCSFSIQLITKPQIAHFQWTSNFIYKQKNNLLICWNPSEAFVFQTPKKLTQKIQLAYTFDKIMRRSKNYQNDNKINSFEASFKHKILIAAFQMGSIKVYKLDETKKYICQLKGHQRECTGLFISTSDPDLLYSCGLDNSIRIWQMIDFSQVYHVRFDIICSKVEMLHEKLLFAKLFDNRRAFFIKINIQLLKPLLSQAKQGQIIRITSDGEWIISLYSNNFIQATLLGQYNNQCRQFQEKIEFPIKYGFFRSCLKLRQNIFAICLEKGFTILKLNKKQFQGENFQLKRLVYNHSLQTKSSQKGKLIQIIHQKLLDTYFFSIVQDWKNIPIAINVTSVSFLMNIAIPKWDLEIKSKSIEEKLDFVILGNDRGQIYFINIKDRTHYHCRVYFHSDTVASVQKIMIKNSDKLNFLSTSVSNEIAIWQISENVCPTILFRINYTKDISVLKVAENNLAIGCKSGQFNILQLSILHDKDKQLVIFSESSSKSEQQGHFKSIIAIDFIKYHGQNVWVTGGEDYAVKLWRGTQKQLLIQFRLFSMINYVTFVKRDIDIIICHGQNNQISVITSKIVQILQQARQKLQCMKNSSSVLTEIDERDFFCPVNINKRIQKLQLDKIDHIEELLHNRSFQKFDHINSERKRKQEGKKQKIATPSKNTQLESNNSVTLPKIGKKFLFSRPPSPRYQKQVVVNQSSILKKLQGSRVKSYSLAGRKNR